MKNICQQLLLWHLKLQVIFFISTWIMACPYWTDNIDTGIFQHYFKIYNLCCGHQLQIELLKGYQDQFVCLFVCFKSDWSWLRDISNISTVSEYISATQDIISQTWSIKGKLKTFSPYHPFKQNSYFRNRRYISLLILSGFKRIK